AGEVADQRLADRAAHAAAEHPERATVAVAGSAHRLGQARAFAVDDHAGALGREVARAEARATRGDHEALEADGEVAQREGDVVDPVGRDLVVEHREAGVDEAGDDPGAGAVLARAVGDAIGDDEDLGREREDHATPATAAARMARPAATGSSAW